MMLRVLSDLGDLTALSVLRRDSTERDISAFVEAVPNADVRVFGLSPMSTSSSPINRARRLFFGLRHLTPPLFYSPYSEELEEFIDMNADQYDLVILLGEASGVYARHFRSRRVVWDKANVFTFFCLNSVYNLRSIRQKTKFLFNAGLSYCFERRVLRSAEAVWVTAPEEGPRLKSVFRRTPDAVIRSSIETSPDNPKRFEPTSRTLVWMSTFGYPPNWDGLRRLIIEAGQVFQENGMTLRVVGAGASDSQIDFLGRFAFVEYVGFAENLDTVFASAAAGVVPIWAGAGVKLKTITMMSRGLPVVSTPAGMEGIPSEAALCVSSVSQDLVSAVARSTEEELRDASSRAFAAVGESFSAAAFRLLVVDGDLSSCR
jgi:hypothetical protein